MAKDGDDVRLPHLKLIGRLLGLAFSALGLLILLALVIGPHLADYRAITVLTASMRPAMPEGSLIVQTPVPVSAVAVGDVITYRIPVDDRRTVTHRVVEVVVGGPHPVVRTKGDANNAPDSWLARLEGDTVWRTRLAVPKAGSALQALRHPLARRISLLVVPAVLALVWLRDIWSSAPARRARSSAPPPATAVHAAPSGRIGERWSGPLAVAALAAVALAVGAHRPTPPGARGARLRS